MKKLFLLVAFFSLVQASKPPKAGIAGQVFWVSGDQMPGPGKTTSPQQGISREIIVYEKVTTDNVEQRGQFIPEINKEPVAKIWSKPDGSFKIKIVPGEYSVFTREPAGLFANTIDQKGCINCVVVKPREFTWVTITVDYEAAY